MGLKEYRSKRDFHHTPEPEGGKEPSKNTIGPSNGTTPLAEGEKKPHEKAVGPSDRTAAYPAGDGKKPSEKGRPLYVIQKHAARRLHYDLRLELTGCLKSWAVPKGPSLDPDEKRLAVHVEDHPLEYASFEGIIPENEYGGGTVMVWDIGEWEPIGDPEEGYRRGRLSFRLHGEKLHGGWSLVRAPHLGRKDEDNWLLIKKKDHEARPAADFNILKERPLSVVSGDSLEKIARSPDSASIDPSSLPGAVKAKQPKRIKPQLASLTDKPPSGDNWLNEIKYDGYRLLCVFKENEVKLLTRHGNDWTDKFRDIAKDVLLLPIEHGILDGEIVVIGPKGISDFQALQNVLKGIKAGTLVYYLFDIPFCEGYDLTGTPLRERKHLLAKIMEKLPGSVSSIRYSDHIAGKGPLVFQQACRMNLEGVVAKRADSPYLQRRTRSWLKIKCLKRQEFVIGGFTERSGAGAGRGFGALLLGYYQDKALIYAGRVGTGFNEGILRELGSQLEKLEQESPPFQNPPPKTKTGGIIHWVAPELAAEVEFSSWTKDKLIRQGSFKGLRQDTLLTDIVREEIEAPPESQPVATSRPKKYPSRIAGVKLTNPDRIFYPVQGITKSELASFYEHIAHLILPHIVERPLTLVRCPHGYQKACFYQKHLNETLPDTIRGILISGKEEEGEYIIIDDAAGLISLVQLGALEIHPWGSREDDLDRPDRLAFDLDPAPDVAWEDVIESAKALHHTLLEIGLKSFVKTSGGKGVHIITPVTPDFGWNEVLNFSRGIAVYMASRFPKRFVSSPAKGKRRGKIYLDYLRNKKGATIAAPYSTRARPGAPVSTPVSWEELSSDLKADAFTFQNLPGRLTSLKKDPWHDFFSCRQSLPEEIFQKSKKIE